MLEEKKKGQCCRSIVGKGESVEAVLREVGRDQIMEGFLFQGKIFMQVQWEVK